MNNGNTYYCGKEEVQKFFSQPRIFFTCKNKNDIYSIKIPNFNKDCVNFNAGNDYSYING